jgi:hypothetical protein
MQPRTFVAFASLALTAHGGHGVGEFYHAHGIASDSKGNIYVGELFGERALRWFYKGM